MKILILISVIPEFDSILLFQIFVLIVIIGLSIATIILSILQIKRVLSLDKITQTSAQSKKDVN